MELSDKPHHTCQYSPMQKSPFLIELEVAWVLHTFETFGEYNNPLTWRESNHVLFFP